MAPKHVAQFKSLVTEGFYDGLDFYRVIEEFVAQCGDLDNSKASQHSGELLAEFSRSSQDNSGFLLLQSPDFIAPQTGFLQGLPPGRDPQSSQEWLLHCPGALAMARSMDANRADFYVVIGQATRHLDRNMSTFGRIIYGMSLIQSLQRAALDNADGIIKDPTKRSKILSARLATELSIKQRLAVQVQDER